MSLIQFEKEFFMNDPISDFIDKQILNVVICIFQKGIGVEDRSLINQMLEKLQIQLKGELDQYKEIYVAFVYETPSLDAKKFFKLERDTQIYYKEPTKSCNFAHVWLMGMALLEQKQKETIDSQILAENRLYLVMDVEVSRTEALLIIQEKEGRLYMHSRFEKVNFKPILFKSEDGKGNLLEEYIQKYGDVKVFKNSGKIEDR